MRLTVNSKERTSDTLTGQLLQIIAIIVIIANFLENVRVKEFWKSASIWRSYV